MISLPEWKFRYLVLCLNKNSVAYYSHRLLAPEILF